MPIERKTFEIDGDNYELCRLPVSQQTILFVALIKQLGESIATALAAGTSEGIEIQTLLNSDLISLLPKGMETLVDRLDPVVLMALCRQVFDGSLVNGQPMFGKSDEGYERFETHFSGRFVHLLKVFGRAVQFNFGPFSGAKQ